MGPAELRVLCSQPKMGACVLFKKSGATFKEGALFTSYALQQQ